jgi:hypothetical protein
VNTGELAGNEEPTETWPASPFTVIVAFVTFAGAAPAGAGFVVAAFAETAAPDAGVFLAAAFAGAFVAASQAELPPEAEPEPESAPFSQFVICWWNGSLL